ncbi:abortive phage infection protein [Acidaminobacter sp. JC074]|uniref:type IV toxin-antitoxin system AbiEi family antitoxin domain-containing protein n=1 Tax=Acidaminobacter sp. JC074 TaxID=2530199 RepID=UPI001F0F4DE1|nr:type IV toxin-antitoxin system AbiEi family antitoxin domain-containing protein [Acidaminobacter sp. JC074]MCH4891114.1 abortive phage infection protein [Acidaminobacter sp. JC074]
MKSYEILRIIDENNGVITVKDALKLGISRSSLYRLKDKGKLQLISSGVFSLMNEIPDVMFIIHNRCRQGVFSHESALYLHDLTDRTPASHVLTVPANYNTSSMKDLPVSFKYVKPQVIDLGRIKMISPQGNEILVYDIERTICDVIKNKSNMDKYLVNNALRLYAERRKSKFSLLMIYAKKLGIEKKVLDTMEVLI